MSANRERIFPHHPSLGNPFSGRERYYVEVRDKKTGQVLCSTSDSGSAEVKDKIIIVTDGWWSWRGKYRAFSLDEVIARGDIRFAK